MIEIIVNHTIILIRGNFFWRTFNKDKKIIWN